MKRFEFSLERVQRWRRSQADIEELKLRQLLADLYATDQRKCRLLEERTQAEAAILSQGIAAAEDLASLDAFRQYVRAQGRALDQIRCQQEEKIAAQRERVIEARRHFELLQRLQHNALAQWQEAFNKEQEEMASELFLAKMNRDS
jgi:hypothetical protein